jgi:hypothetical protein
MEQIPGTQARLAIVRCGHHTFHAAEVMGPGAEKVRPCPDHIEVSARATNDRDTGFISPPVAYPDRGISLPVMVEMPIEDEGFIRRSNV